MNMPMPVFERSASIFEREKNHHRAHRDRREKIQALLPAHGAGTQGDSVFSVVVFDRHIRQPCQ
jgi:hypothetical protein